METDQVFDLVATTRRARSLHDAGFLVQALWELEFVERMLTSGRTVPADVENEIANLGESLRRALRIEVRAEALHAPESGLERALYRYGASTIAGDADAIAIARSHADSDARQDILAGIAGRDLARAQTYGEPTGSRSRTLIDLAAGRADDALRALALAHHDTAAGLYASAAAHIYDVVTARPGDPEPWLLAARLAAPADPDHPFFHAAKERMVPWLEPNYLLDLAAAQRAAGETSRCHESLQRALDLQPTCARARADIAEMTFATEEMDRAVEDDPDEPLIRFKRMVLHLERKNLPAAVRDADVLERIAPRWTNTWLARATVARATGSTSTRDIAIRRAMELWKTPATPENLNAAAKELDRLQECPPLLLCAFGQILVDSGHRDAGLKAIRRAVDGDPELAAARVGLGKVEMVSRKYADAIPHFERAVKLSPFDFQALHALGLAYDGVGRRDDAIEQWLRCYELDSAPGLRKPQGRKLTLMLAEEKISVLFHERYAEAEEKRSALRELARRASTS